ncbi:uncharacterized protein LOC144179446 [Haemaphysalis longicornis]
MSSLSASSDASADEASKADELPLFRSLTKNKQAKRRKKWKNYGGFEGLKFFDLSEKQKQREREKLREELKDVIAEQAKIDDYEIKTEPFRYKTRESSLSPHTPPGRPEWEDAPLQDTLQDVTLPGTSTSDTVCDSPEKAKRFVYRYVVSSDDESLAPSQRRAPPLRNCGRSHSVDSEVVSADAGAGGWDTSDTDGGDRPRVNLPEVPTSPKLARTLSSLDHEEGFEEPRASAEGAPPTSVTKENVRRKHRKILEHERSLYRSWSNRRSSSAESTSSREAAHERRFPLAAPRSRASGDADHLPLRTRELSSHGNHRRHSPATSHSTAGDSDAEALLGQLATPTSRKRQSVHYLSSLSSGSGGSKDTHRSKAGSAFSVWHSTPVVGWPRATPSPTGVGCVHGSSRQMFAAGADRLLDENLRRRALDRGDIRVELTISEPGQQASSAGVAAHGTDQTEAMQHHGTSGSSQQRGRLPAQSGAFTSGSSGSSTAHRSIVVRIGLGWSRERVLVSNAASATSAIASFCGEEEPPEQHLNASGASYNVEPEDILNQLLKLCGQERPVTFEEALQLGQNKGIPQVIRKLGEGCAGEVYLVRRGALRADESVLKVVPVGGNRLVDGLKPQSLAGASAEVAIARELSNLRFNATNRTANFIGLKGAHCVHGPYHPALLACWKEYEERLCSQNENPEVFSDEQLYLILEFEYGGKPLENFKGSAEQLESVFVQLSCSLAAAEFALRFEHRDLHTDNVLVRRTSEEHATYALQGTVLKVPTAGVWASVIDYTLSRISKGHEAEYAATKMPQSVLFTDLALDSQLFGGSGSYQYDIYRIMRERNGNDWQTYDPFTNVMWLDYTARKLLAKRPRCPGGVPPPMCARLAEWQNQLPSFPSAGAFVTQCLFPAPRPANRKRRKEHAPPPPGYHAMALRRK